MRFHINYTDHGLSNRAYVESDMIFFLYLASYVRRHAANTFHIDTSHIMMVHKRSRSRDYFEIHKVYRFKCDMSHHFNTLSRQIFRHPMLVNWVRSPSNSVPIYPQKIKFYGRCCWVGFFLVCRQSVSVREWMPSSCSSFRADPHGLPTFHECAGKKSRNWLAKKATRHNPIHCMVMIFPDCFRCFSIGVPFWAVLMFALVSQCSIRIEWGICLRQRITGWSMLQRKCLGCFFFSVVQGSWTIQWQSEKLTRSIDKPNGIQADFITHLFREHIIASLSGISSNRFDKREKTWTREMKTTSKWNYNEVLFTYFVEFWDITYNRIHGFLTPISLPRDRLQTFRTHFIRCMIENMGIDYD